MMTGSKLTASAIVGLGVCFLAAGCNQKEQQEIEALYAEKDQLMQQNSQLQEQIALAAQREADLLGQIDAKDQQITSMEARIQTLGQQATAAKAPAQQAPQGWEVGQVADRVTVGSDILFGAGRATLTRAGQQALNRIVRDLKSAYSGLPIRVYGYTDADPIKRTKRLWKDNLDLSSNRAMAVTRHLTERGIPPESIETIGMGATHFVASNTTTQGKAKNRRVEILVVKTLGK